MEAIYSWLGFLLFWVVVLIGAFVLLGVVVMTWASSLVGYRYIGVGERAHLESVRDRIVECRRWFGGFHDLDMIWEYLLEGDLRRIDQLRDRYARARNTSVYGDPLPVSVEGDRGRTH